MNKKGLITICARGGSKGMPGKNIRKINGKPLIYYSIRVAEELRREMDVDIFLSTDSMEILDTVKTFNFSINTEYIRPDILATDSAGKLDAIIDVLEYAEHSRQINYDYVIDLDVTSPLRTIVDLKNAYKMLWDEKEALNIFSVSPCHRNPYFNMVEQDDNSVFFKLCKKGEFLTRQSAPKVYDMNASFYIFKKAFFQTNSKTVITDRSLVYEVPHLCFDIDHPIDFEFMEFLITNNKLDFELI